jgi:aspartate/glutamate racemase
MASTAKKNNSFISLSDFKSYLEQINEKQTLKLSRKVYRFSYDANLLEASELYLKVQKLIADKIPSEYNRPVISLKLYSNHYHLNSKHIGILGEMGPLSDAHLLNKIIKNLRKSRVNSGYLIHLFSLPPPRKTSEQIIGGVKYFLRLRTFLNKNYKEYYLASNTAHLNFNIMKKIASSANIIYLPSLISNKVKDSISDESVVVLGTTTAWKKKLYPKVLRALNVKTLNPISSEQKILQSWINRIKENYLIPSKAIELLDHVRSLAMRKNSKYILLACTELPLGLGDNIRVLENEGFTIFDTEDMFAEIIAESLLKD